MRASISSAEGIAYVHAMCGIAGHWSPEVLDSSGLVQRMSDQLAHRGPDGFGVWASAGIHLAHRRLSIVDLTPTGAQPMTSRSGRFTIAFNGEVYNFKELRDNLDLRSQVPRWKGTSDTEVMLEAIEAWGLEAAARRFVGMFAFALWDQQDHCLWLVRDRLGVKPLYWTQTPSGLAFASELKALRLFPGFDTSINQEALAGFLQFNCVPGERSIHVGTHRQEPGTLLRFASPTAAPSTTRYWDPVRVARAGLSSPFSGTEQEAIDELDRRLRDSVRLRMVADVPLGAFLSGGIDSSTVVALMQAQSSRPVHTFSIENETAAWDEGPAARRVAHHLGTKHTSFTVTARDALEVIPRLPTMFDEPFADSSQIPTYLVSSLARKHVTVALSGDGGDELFGGYARHVWGPWLWRAEQLLPSRARRWLSRAISHRSPAAWDKTLPRVRMAGIRMHKVAAALGATSSVELHQSFATHWRPADLLVQPIELPAPRRQLDDVASDFMLADLTRYLPDDILTKVDRASMAVSLEAREPLLDHRLVEFAWSLPRNLKVRGATGKWALRQVLQRYVPRELVSGPKMGFAVPLGDWLRGPLKDWGEELLDERRLDGAGVFRASVIREKWRQLQEGTHPWEYLLWDVLMFEAWRDSLRA